jgi:hypothetical protein
MGSRWQVQIKGTQRKEADRQLLIQAVIALGRQFKGRDEQEQTTEPRQKSTPEGKTG